MISSQHLLDRALMTIEHPLTRLAAQRKMAVLIVFVIGPGNRLVVLPIKPIPTPRVHAEFSCGSIVDTITYRRLRHPMQPRWVNVEGKAISQSPT